MTRRTVPVFLLLLTLLAGCTPRPAPAPPRPPVLGKLPPKPVAPDLASFLRQPLGYSLPQRLTGDRIIAEVLRLHAANGGATVSPYFGDLGGQKLFAVSIYPELTTKLKGKTLTEEPLRAYLSKRQTLLSDPRCSIGTWFEDKSKLTYLDICVTLATRQQALDLGRRYNQISIFSLSDFKELPTGGTGEPKPNWPPLGKRLPPLPVPMPPPGTVPAPVPAG